MNVYPTHATLGTTITSEGVLSPGSPLIFVTPIATLDPSTFAALFWSREAHCFVPLNMDDVVEPTGLSATISMLQEWEVEDDLDLDTSWYGSDEDDEEGDASDPLQDA